MRSFDNWKNHLQALFIPVVSFLAFAWALQSFARLDETGQYYVRDDFKLPAPGAATPDKPGILDELEYYRWTYLVSPIVDPAPKNAEEAKAALENITSKAAGDPAKEREALLEEIRSKAPGPYQPYIWAWYKREVEYERSHKEQVAALEKNKKEWLANYLAEKKFDADNAAEIKKRQDERAAAARMNPLMGTILLGVQWDRKNAEAIAAFQKKRAEFVAAFAKKLLENPAELPESAWAGAEPAYADALATLKASPIFRPEIYKKIQEAKVRQKAEDPTLKKPLCPENNCSVEDFAILVEIEAAFNQALDVQDDSSVDMPPFSTVGFDGYTIIEAPIDAVAATYQFRNGLPVGAKERGWKEGATYPNDKLFEYRREKFSDMTDVWGPGAHFNTSIKQRSTEGGSFVKGLSDAYAVFARGNAKAGYDIVFQFLGKACFPEEEQKLDDCNSLTKSSFTILMLRPIDEKRTAFKMSGRFNGQSYQTFREVGYWEVGFNAPAFLRGQFEFNVQARKLAAAQEKLSAARAAGKPVIQLDSRDGWYFLMQKPVKLGAGEKPTDKHYPISAQQNFYLVDGELVQLIEDRGSRDFDNYPMQAFPLKEPF